jgi:methylthioribose-1-phosphate isomerase
MKAVFEENRGKEDLYEVLLSEALRIHQEDIKLCDAIAENGLQIFEKSSNVLTHCNTGQLATGGEGTAFNVIKRGFESGLVKHVYVDETRPLLQGSRLTAFELDKAGIPFSIITDSTAPFLMQKKKIDIALVGADRIAANGDTANKIGTYGAAVACRHHNIPFYIAAPETTIDPHCNDGGEIDIELRHKSEITRFGETPITKESYDVYAPAFDVTPASLIAGIITDKNLYRDPYRF